MRAVLRARTGISRRDSTRAATRTPKTFRPKMSRTGRGGKAAHFFCQGLTPNGHYQSTGRGLIADDAGSSGRSGTIPAVGPYPSTANTSAGLRPQASPPSPEECAMNMLRRWLRNGFASDATSADRRNPRRRVQPALERLEDRCTPAVTFHGGVTLPHVEVESLFYGANWYNNSTLYQDTGYLNGFLQHHHQQQLHGHAHAGRLQRRPRCNRWTAPSRWPMYPGRWTTARSRAFSRATSATASCNRRTAIVCISCSSSRTSW